MPAYGLKKETKYVTLRFIMKSEHQITGQYHVLASTSGAIRPSDALNEADKFISLVNARIVRHDGGEYQVPFIQVARDAVAWIEFPPMDKSWARPAVSPVENKEKS